MHYEVEQKYRVASLKPTVGALAAMDASWSEPISQVDCYYRHPQRDFSQTDEAFRLRSVGQQNYLTYKGPKLDQHTKTRSEQEVRLADGEKSRAACDEIVCHLGFSPAATVRKQRTTCRVQRGEFSIEIALDQVETLGAFVEIEIGVEVSPENTEELDRARATLASVADELSLSDVERLSYLELLLGEGK